MSKKAQPKPKSTAGSVEPEIIPPNSEDVSAPSQSGDEMAVLALVSNYTDRPDLFLAEVEKHDPGFVKRMNASAEAHSKEIRARKFSFGERQAYASLSVAVLAAFVVFGVLAYAVAHNAGFWTIIGLAVFYAVSQGGTGGFSKIISACSKAISTFKSKNEE